MPSTVPINTRTQAERYRQRGWYCVPLRPRSKSPARRDWTNLQLAPEVFPEKSNIGIILDEPSGWLVDVDLDCDEAIELAVIVKRGVLVPIKLPTPKSRAALCIDIEPRAIAYLDAMPPAIGGSGGHSQTFAAATALVHGFGIDPDSALAILAQHYNPRCVPPWSDKELAHKINQAATKPHDRPLGWLRDDGPIQPSGDVDLSGFMVKPKPVAMAIQSTEPKPSLDPGHLPERLFNVPGFVRRVMDFTLANAPYPNIGLAMFTRSA